MVATENALAHNHTNPAVDQVPAPCGQRAFQRRRYQMQGRTKRAVGAWANITENALGSPTRGKTQAALVTSNKRVALWILPQRSCLRAPELFPNGLVGSRCLDTQPSLSGR